MPVSVSDIAPAAGLFGFSLLIVSGSLWLAVQVAPLFVRGFVRAPDLASFFLDPKAETEEGWERSAVGLLAAAFSVISVCGLILVARLTGLAG